MTQVSRRKLLAAATAGAATAAAAALDPASASASPDSLGLGIQLDIPPHLDDLRKQIFDQFHRADNHLHLRRLVADKNARLMRSYAPRIVKNNLRDDGGGEHYSLRPVKGSVMMFTAKPGHDLLDRLERAYVSGDRGALQRLSTEIDAEVSRRRVIPVSSAVDMLAAAPAYFDLLYDGKLLAGNVGLVNGLEYGSMLFPWNGGRLRADDFTIVEYTKPSARPDVETLLVLTEPDLTQIEREALEAVPEEMLGLNLGTSAASPFACLVIVMIFVLVTHAGGCGQFHDRLAEVSLPADVIEKLGKVNSAVELLSRRRQMFADYGM